jgi:hypothetical protein
MIYIVNICMIWLIVRAQSRLALSSAPNSRTRILPPRLFHLPAATSSPTHADLPSLGRHKPRSPKAVRPHVLHNIYLRHIICYIICYLILIYARRYEPPSPKAVGNLYTYYIILYYFISCCINRTQVRAAEPKGRVAAVRQHPRPRPRLHRRRWAGPDPPGAPVPGRRVDCDSREYIDAMR